MLSDDKVNVEIILPERSEDSLSESLCSLTEYLCVNRIGDDHDGSGGLGGQYGYGVDYENDTFMLHRFCWCMRADCDWCVECECSEDGSVKCNNCETNKAAKPNFLHKPSGSSVYWYKWIGRSMNTDLSDDWTWRKVLADCFRSIGSPRC